MLWLDEMKAVKITWKKEEKWLYDFVVKDRSSPAAWFKDLAIAEYKRQKEEEQPKNTPFNFLD